MLNPIQQVKTLNQDVNTISELLRLIKETLQNPTEQDIDIAIASMLIIKETANNTYLKIIGGSNEK